MEHGTLNTECSQERVVIEGVLSLVCLTPYKHKYSFPYSELQDFQYYMDFAHYSCGYTTSCQLE